MELTAVSGYLRGDLAAVTARKIAEGRAAWPALAVSDDAITSALARYLARTVADVGHLAVTLEVADAAELAAAAACAQRIEGAERAVEQRYFPAAAASLARFKLTPAL